MERKEDFVKECIQYGAFKAFVTEVKDINFDKGLRAYCEMNYCGSFGKNYACPPTVGAVDAVISKAKSFQNALIFQTVNSLEDSYDFEGMEAAKEYHETVAAKIRDMVEEKYPVHLPLTAGGCPLCEECAILSNKPCRFPDRAVSSLEAYCINVSTLAETCQMKYINGKDTVTYFGGILY